MQETCIPHKLGERKGEDKMKLIRTEDAVGSVLCHDITQIIPGVVKDAVFRKGHVVTEEDVPVLLSVGKEHLYVWEKQEGMLHENDAAEVLRQVCQGEHMNASEAKEGKIELTAQCDGLLKINREKLNEVNALGQIVLASRHGNFPVKKGDKIAEEIVEEFGAYLGHALANLAAITDPSVIVIGGGVSKAGDILLKYVEKAFKERAFFANEDTRLVLATLGNDAGICGAAKLIL